MNTLAHETQGSGDDVVVLLHGIGGGRSVWGDGGSATTQALAAIGCRAVAVDLPGYGDSVGFGPPSLVAMVDGVVALIVSLAPRRCAIVGHSMGGMVAQELLATTSGLAQAVVLACTSAAFGKPGGDWQARFVSERLAPLDAGHGMAAVARQLVPAMVSPRGDGAALPQAVAVMSRVPEPTYRAALQAIVAFDRREALAHLGVPALCLAAADDRTAPPDVMQRMAQRIPGSEYVCLPDAGHIANLEQPAAFNAAVAGFLRRHGFGS